MISNNGTKVMGTVFIRDARGLKFWKKRYLECETETGTLRLFSNDQMFHPKATWRIEDVTIVQAAQQLKVDTDTGFHFNIAFAGEKTMKLKTLSRDERNVWVDFLTDVIESIHREKEFNREVTEIVSYLSGLSTLGIYFQIDIQSFLDMPNGAHILAELRKNPVWLSVLDETLSRQLTGKIGSSSTEIKPSETKANPSYVEVTTIELRCGRDITNKCIYSAAEKRLILFVSVCSLDGTLDHPTARDLNAILTSHPWKLKLLKIFNDSHKGVCTEISNALGGVHIELHFSPEVTYSGKLTQYLKDYLGSDFLKKFLQIVRQAESEVVRTLGEHKLYALSSLQQYINQISIVIEEQNVEQSIFPNVSFLAKVESSVPVYRKKQLRWAFTIPATNPSGSGYLSNDRYIMGNETISLDNLYTILVDIWYRTSITLKIIATENALYSEGGLDATLSRIRWDCLANVLDKYQLPVTDRVATSLHVCQILRERISNIRKILNADKGLVTNLFVTFTAFENAGKLFNTTSLDTSGKLAETIFISGTNTSKNEKIVDSTFLEYRPKVPRHSSCILVPKANIFLLLEFEHIEVFVLSFQRAQKKISGEQEGNSDSGDVFAPQTTVKRTLHQNDNEQRKGSIHALELGNPAELSDEKVATLIENIAVGFEHRIAPREVLSVTREGLARLSSVFPRNINATISRSQVCQIVHSLIEYEFQNVEQTEARAVENVLTAAAAAPRIQFEHVALGALPLIIPNDVIQGIMNRRELLVCGLDGVGKTSLINHLQGKHEARLFPTVGYRSEMIFFKHLNLRCTEIGGSPEQRERWNYVFKHVPQVDGIIFVIDANSRATTEARRYLKTILTSKHVKRGTPVLTLANFATITDFSSEIDSARVTTIEESLKLRVRCQDLKIPWLVVATHIPLGGVHSKVLKSDHCTKIDEAMAWLEEKLKRPGDAPRRIRQPTQFQAAPKDAS